jgi:cobalt-zinc-cadmium efflux system protein
VAHTHQHAPRSANRRRLQIALALAASYMLAEVAGGLLTNSLALLADAGHMLGDVGALALSLFALWIADRPASTRFTFGYYRTEILAALVNGAALLAIAAMILLEAVGRLSAPPAVAGAGMLAVATGGLVVNLVALFILGGGRHESLNLRGAWLHVASDALGSVGAMTAGALVWGFGWYWADPVASLVIVLFVVYSAFSLLREAVSVLMEGAPGHLDVDQIRDALVGLECVDAIHDLHVWTITSGVVSLSCHAVKMPSAVAGGVLSEIREVLRDRFGIDHVTVQVESEAMETHPACE